jgi:7-cyano-7-deazaguanine synthase in queuosine biosynthesis
VLEALQCGRKVALVSHRPADKVYARQRELAAAVAARVQNLSRAPLHVPVEVNKGKALSRDFNQRTRSFLFLAVAAVVARALGLPRVRAYENGVVSLNLAISPQLLGARASRSTHPLFLDRFGRLCGLIFGGSFEVQNPFLWQTKAEVLRQIRGAEHGRLCAAAVSCGGTMAATRQFPHCGRCSQCVDRRLTALAAGLDDHEDPPSLYAADVLTGPRDGPELTLIERYLGTALHVRRMQDVREFVHAFPEVTRVIGHVGMPAARAAELVFDLYRRHATQICDALAAQVQLRSAEIVLRDLAPNSLLSLACGRRAVAAIPTTASPRAAAGEPHRLLTLDGDRFLAVWETRPCFLGNTMEYRLLARLHESPGQFVPVQTLAEQVWGDAETRKNTIQTTVTNLRRRLRDTKLFGVRIDGSQRGHYRLDVVPLSACQVSA